MKSKKLNTNKLNWESSILELSSSKTKPKNLQKLFDAGYSRIQDLLNILPLRVNSIPPLRSFDYLSEGDLFLGHGLVINHNFSPSYGRKGKNRAQLFNATIIVKDKLSNKFLNLKWFNVYPNLKKQLEQLGEIHFFGQVQVYNESYQIINPELNPKLDTEGILREYPTVSTVSGSQIKKYIDKIPKYLWEKSLKSISFEIEDFLDLDPLIKSYKTRHGLTKSFTKEAYKNALQRIIYNEFLKDQLKVTARKLSYKKHIAPIIEYNDLKLEKIINSFNYDLTQDQEKVVHQCLSDFRQGHPMMRIIQGDVGCGKTTVSLILAYLVAIQAGQVALMCPTEALAQQHFKSFSSILGNEVNIEILLGSTKSKEKVKIQEKLKLSKIDIIIGTHSLFQDSVEFSNLQFVIIDEQHKFGVEQRLKLVSKGNGAHTLLMSATPIPRTLQLAQFGDLEISTIKTLPPGRKGTQTRIIKNENYEKYLSFLKTRISLNEQAYIVVPAITESEVMDIKNVETHIKVYKKFFPQMKIEALHGQLKSEEKQNIVSRFEKGEVDILISTSVIEVGINIVNATVMSIYMPERFGLSSLHQLRGRVGRGQKAGFCFLIPDKNISTAGIQRLKILENSSDGFIIAEADLKNRGEGDLFGAEQSGSGGSKKLASIFDHLDLFTQVQSDIAKIMDTQPSLLTSIVQELIQDKKISTTV